MRQWEEVQEMSRSRGLVLAGFLIAGALFADDQALWREYGLVNTQVNHRGSSTITVYRMKDLTGALAAWEWLRPSDGRACDEAPFCTEDGKQTVIADDNYVVKFEGPRAPRAEIDAVLNALPDKRESSLPAILTFLPHEGRVPNSARYVLGPVSLQTFAPDLAAANPGFDQGAEAQVAEYHVGKNAPPVHLAIFYYPSPEMARLHAAKFKELHDAHVKRSSVLVAVVFGRATDDQADTLLSRVEYEAKITWNDVPPPSPIKPLFQLLVNIVYLSIVLSAICLMAGLMYAGMRIYRRRYGTLESEEAMTTLNLRGD